MARRLGPAGLVGAGLVSGVAAWTALNRAVVKQLTRRDDSVDPAALGLPDGLREHTLVMSDGWVIRACERGPKDGPAVVLLHGITLGAAVWPYQLSALADAGLRVIAIDQRGHGLSGGIATLDEEPGSRPSGLTLARMATDVREILDALDLESVTVVGHSMGGMVTLELLRADPELAAGHGRISRLVLAGTTANATRGRGVPGLSDAVALAQPLLSSVSGLAGRLPGPTLPANDLAFLLARVTFGDRSSHRQVAYTGYLTSETPVRVSAELLVEIIRFAAEDVLPTIHLPTTVIVGDHDLMTPRPQSEYMASHIAGANLIVLEGCGHMLMLERPDELNRAILDLANR
ncbi:MAG TPA: alpha/beta hydrolase [Acidimicrobiales bacterium]|nr:alpha/beta hydrolase [Acidimicrobiales bacterium]